jgi:hypothetical protein
MNQTVRIIRDIFFKTFLISLIAALLFAGVYFGWRARWIRIVVEQFQLIDEKSLNLVVMEFFMWIRFYLIFVLLAPALALHWTLKRLQS